MADLIYHLRAMACNGHPIGDEAADEIESWQEAYGLLFKKNADLLAHIAKLEYALEGLIKPCRQGDIECETARTLLRNRLSMHSCDDPLCTTCGNP